MNTVTLQGIPTPLVWDLAPVAHQVAADGSLSITAGKVTDLFTSPAGDFVGANSPRLLFTPSGDFTLSARVTVNHSDTFDAGVLVVWEHASSWAKLCFEFSPQRERMVVSVVTRGLSDDCNSVIIEPNWVYMRVARIGRALAFHYSRDGRRWHFVRHFTLDNPDKVKVGFSSQAPRGDACTATFSEISYVNKTLSDLRNGE